MKQKFASSNLNHEKFSYKCQLTNQFLTASCLVDLVSCVCNFQVCLVMEYAEGGSLYNGKLVLHSAPPLWAIMI